jgi:uncharacterized membrane protein (UPF0127 family)
MANERLCVYNLTRQSFLSLGVRVADTQWARLRGLLGHLRLQADDGIWMVPSQVIHTIGLTFPVDVVYLDASSRVIQVIEHLGPFRVGPLRSRARSVLELPIKSVFCSNTQIGDQFVICSPEELALQLKSHSGDCEGGPAMGKGAEGNPVAYGPPPTGSWRARISRWFRDVGERRQASRCAIPGVAAYYWDGGSPQPHGVLNLSTAGAYISTPLKWYPGTIIELTLQMAANGGGEPSESRLAVHLPCRVVRCGGGAVGVRFLYTSQAQRIGIKKLEEAIKAP